MALTEEDILENRSIERDYLLKRRLELVKGLDDRVGLWTKELLNEIESSRNWQPAHLLPDFRDPSWPDRVRELQGRVGKISDDLLVVLVGDLVTEEALPSYFGALQAAYTTRDITGTSQLNWPTFARLWTAEENRHGDVLSTYLGLSGRVNMGAVQQTTQHLLASGFDPQSGEDPYKMSVYTAFQELATQCSHINTARLARKQGDEALFKICTLIAGDEARHAAFYSRAMGAIFEQDPNGAMLSYERMMSRKVIMPAQQMYDGKDPDLFDHFAEIAQRIGVYTAGDYATIMAELNKRWDISHRVVSGEASRAQELLARLPQRYERLSDRLKKRPLTIQASSFSWIN